MAWWLDKDQVLRSEPSGLLSLTALSALSATATKDDVVKAVDASVRAAITDVERVVAAECTEQNELKLREEERHAAECANDSSSHEDLLARQAMLHTGIQHIAYCRPNVAGY